MRGFLNKRVLVDAGAYTGDTIECLTELGIVPSRVYCFEADSRNFEKLKSKKTNQNTILENLALWDKKKRLTLQSSNFNSNVMDGNDGNRIDYCDAVCLDDYFINKHVDFIKMDIEGAEQKALEGSRNVIKRDRPILAIAIYHSLDDMVEIPLKLVAELERYSFFVRHYSATLSETVLYCIPKELHIVIE